MKPSLKDQLNQLDWINWGKNFVKFVTPTLAVFFGQLAMGVDFRIALPVALLALYQSLADLFGKYKAGK